MKHMLGFLFAVVLFGNVYSENTSAPARPWQDKLVGEFGATVEVPVVRRLLVSGTLNNLIINDHGVRSLAGVQYGVAARLSVTDRFAITGAHRSWHNIDRVGSTEQYNRVGVEIRVQ